MLFKSRFAGHLFLFLHYETPETVLIFPGGVGNAHTFSRSYSAAETVVGDEEVLILRKISAVMSAGYPETAGELPGAIRSGTCADEHGFRPTLLAGDHIEEPVNAVAQINVCGARP